MYILYPCQFTILLCTYYCASLLKNSGAYSYDNHSKHRLSGVHPRTIQRVGMQLMRHSSFVLAVFAMYLYNIFIHTLSSTSIIDNMLVNYRSVELPPPIRLIGDYHQQSNKSSCSQLGGNSMSGVNPLFCPHVMQSVHC